LNYPEGYVSSTDDMVAKLLERGTLEQPPFAFVETKVLSREVESGRVREVIQFELDPQVVGNHPLSFFGIPFYPEDEKGEQYTELISPVFNVQVVAAPSDPNYRGVTSPPLTFDTAYPITPNLENRRRFMDKTADELAEINTAIWRQRQISWMPFVFLLLLGVLIYFVSRKPRPETAEQRAFRAQKEALNALENLRSKRLPQTARFEDYYVELTDTIRRFLEEKYNLSASTQTTREFLASLAQRPLFEEETQKSLKDFLVRADLVKFARYSPSKDECAYAEMAAKKVITSK
jgi:hypothetical protein